MGLRYLLYKQRAVQAMLEAWASISADTHLARPSAFSLSAGCVKIWAFPALPQSALRGCSPSQISS
jgi:hypothetical protein